MTDQDTPRDAIERAVAEALRRKILTVVAVLAIVGVIFVVPVLLVLPLLGDWERVQVLQSADRRHLAELERLYGYIDVNFCITLDGKEIHRSWDCAPNATIPFRETLAWDDTGNVLVFELANEIVFAYDLPSQTEIPPSRFDEITVPKITLKDIGFEGRDELELEKQQGTEPVAAP
jgi:hypothetical protein